MLAGLSPLIERRQECPSPVRGTAWIGKDHDGAHCRERSRRLKSDDTLSLNASDERGIDTVRERVKIFANYSDRREGVPFRLVILDEADEMTRDAQTALRRIMEESSQFTRFILVCNYSSNIIEPIQSRCAIFRFQRLGSEDVVGYLKKIAHDEGLKVDDGALSAIYGATNGDLRQAINLIQAAAAGGQVTTKRIDAVAGTIVREGGRDNPDRAGRGLQCCETEARGADAGYGIPETDFLRYANEAITAGTTTTPSTWPRRFGYWPSTVTGSCWVRAPRSSSPPCSRSWLRSESESDPFGPLAPQGDKGRRAGRVRAPYAHPGRLRRAREVLRL